MTNNRWAYQVVEAKPGFFGVNRDAIQDRLNQQHGWELISVVQAHGSQPTRLFFKKEALNHLAIAGEGLGTLAEYSTPGHVDTGLIDDVATWIRRH